MKRPLDAINVALAVAVLGTLLVGTFFSQSSQAEEQEIRSTGGAYLGKFRFKEIDPSDALLEFKLAGRTIISVKSGFIGNRSYSEVWDFESSWIDYERLPKGYAYRVASFNERKAPIRFCGEEIEQNCDLLRSEKLSRNLIVVTYRDRETGEACGGLEYIGEDRSSRGAGSYGNYNVVVGTCLPATANHEEALALSAHYLSLIKKDGRTIARLSRYDLPIPRTLPSRSNGSGVDPSESTAALDPDKVLAYWRTNQNVLRKLISKETGGLRSGTLAFDEFDIVGAQSSQADPRYVELHTVYTLQFGSGSSALVASTEDSLGTPHYQTLIVNPRDNSVVEVRPATTERPR
jgi:hypothetical protein